MYHRQPSNSDNQIPNQIFQQQSRYLFLPEITLYQQFKSLQNIPNTSRVQDDLLYGRHSDQIHEPQTSRVRQNLKNKKVIFNQVSQNLQQGLLRKIDTRVKDNCQLKSILKGSNNSRHSDIFDFFESIDKEQEQPIRNNKYVTLVPLESSIHLSPRKFETISPKRVSFNRKIQVKFINDDEIDMNRQSRHSFRRQLSEIIN